MKLAQPLHTGTILLRAPEPEDIDEMLSFENDESLWENSCTTGPYSRYQLKKYIAENQNDLFTDGQLRLMIEHASGNVAGIVDLFSFDARHRRAEIGIVIKEQYRRQDIAYNALGLLERHCFHLLGIHQLYAYIRTDNTACLNLFKKLGYTFSATLKDWIYTSRGYKDICIAQKLQINYMKDIEGK